MSHNRNSHHISQRMAEAAVQEMCACTAATMVDQIIAKRQVVCHIPVGGNDPMGVPDF